MRHSSNYSSGSRSSSYGRGSSYGGGYKSSSRFPLIRILLVCGLAYLAWNYLGTKESPADAIKQLASNSLSEKETRRLQKTAAKDPELAPWSSILAAKAFSEMGANDLSLEALESANHTGASSVLKNYIKVRANLQIEEQVAPAQIALLRSKLENSGFLELLPMLESDWIDYRQAKPGNLEDKALSREFFELAKKYPKSEVAVSARKKLEVLYGEKPSQAELFSLAELYLEAGESAKSLEIVHKGLSAGNRNSLSYFQFLDLKQKALRASGSGEESDALLVQLASSNHQALADEAMLEIAKRAWTINDHQRAIDFLNRLIGRYPSSNLIPEAKYILGRVLQERGEISNALSLYKSVFDAGVDRTQVARALRRWSWLSLSQGEETKALQGFKKLTDYEDYSREASWWLFSFSKPDSKKQISTPANKLPDYYSSLAKQAGLLARPSQEACPYEISDNLSKRVAHYKGLSLPELVLYEAALEYPIGGLSSQEDLRNAFLQSKVLSNSGLFGPSVRLADKAIFHLGLNFDKESKLEELMFPRECLAPLAKLAWPKINLDKTGDISLDPLGSAVLREEILSGKIGNRPMIEAFSGAGSKATDTSATETKDEKLSKDFRDQAISSLKKWKHLRALYANRAEALAAFKSSEANVSRWRERNPNLSPEEWVESIPFPKTKDFVKEGLRGEFIYKLLYKEQ